MKVAVFHNLPSGGAKRILHGFVKSLVGLGHSVDAMIPSTACEEFMPLNSATPSVRVFPVRRTLRGYVNSYLHYIPPTEISLSDLKDVQEDIARTIDSGGYDVVLCEQDQFTQSPFMLRILKTPTVYFCQQPSRSSEAIVNQVAAQAQSVSPPPSVRERISDRFARRLPGVDRENGSFANYILANSQFSREAILRAYGRRCYVSYLGVDTGFFRPLGLPREDFVLSVGACRPSKGFDFVIRYLGSIERSVRPELRIVANEVTPTWKKFLESVASEHGVQVSIQKALDDGSLLELYNRAKLVVYAPYLEPFGLVPLEAMACGTPVVGVREGGVRESIADGVTGLLTDRDEQEFASAVQKLHSSQGITTEMGRNGLRHVASSWTLEHAGARLLSHLERAAREGHPG